MVLFLKFRECEKENKGVFKKSLKREKEKERWTLVGTSFQNFGAIIEKALSPIREELEREKKDRGEDEQKWSLSL